MHFRTLAVGCLVVACGAPAAAQLPNAADAAVARPLSPAALVLLLPHMSRPDAAARVAEALRDGRADVRAVAARVAFVTGRPDLASALQAALDQEADVLAAAEEVRALALIAGAAGDESCVRAIARHGDPLARAWVSVVGRTRPLDALPRLAELGAPAGRLARSLARTDGAAVTKVFAGLSSSPKLSALYLAALSSGRLATDPLPWPLLAIGLEASGAERRAAVHYLLERRTAGDAVPDEAGRALADLRARRSTLGDAWLSIALELTRRADAPTTPPESLDDAFSTLGTAAAMSADWSRSWMRYLTDTEEAVLRGRFRTAIPERSSWTPPPTNPAIPRLRLAPPDANVIRLALPAIPALAIDVGEETGCRPGENRVLVVETAYRPTGQVREVMEPVGGGADKCGLAARLIAALEVAPGDPDPVPAVRHDLVMIGFRREDAECARMPIAARRAREMRVGGRIRPPAKTLDVHPVYPTEMIRNRVQGISIVDAIISPGGCVAEATVLTGPHPTINAAALAAVSQWRYSPVTLDGQPVTINMIVTVNFSLQP